ncbi:hypothetical protein HZA86_04950 [Candidatus Uhrbacteria bacterium]|nr:hypothetical protein [Candidatus Uhrbacteria bacterium]
MQDAPIPEWLHSNEDAETPAMTVAGPDHGGVIEAKTHELQTVPDTVIETAVDRAIGKLAESTNNITPRPELQEIMANAYTEIVIREEIPQARWSSAEAKAVLERAKAKVLELLKEQEREPQ